MTLNIKTILPAMAILAAATQANASTIAVNQGFNIVGQNILQYGFGVDSSAVAVPFYDALNSSINDDAGTEIKPFTFFPLALGNDIYSITFDSSAVFGQSAFPGSALLSASLYIDAFDVDNNDKVNVLVNGVNLGLLGNFSSGLIPVAGGGYTTLAGETDNTVFDLTGALLADLATDNTFNISFTRVGSGTRVVLDGINIQAMVSTGPGGDVIPGVPEPATLLFLGSGLIGFTIWGRKRTAASNSPITRA
jgi:hypothetical protein